MRPAGGTRDEWYHFEQCSTMQFAALYDHDAGLAK